MVLGERLGGSLTDKLSTSQARVGIIGLGYAGLPMAVEIAQAGYAVTGVDVEPRTVDSVNSGRSPVSDVADDVLMALVSEGLVQATSDYQALDDVDVVV